MIKGQTSIADTGDGRTNLSGAGSKHKTPKQRQSEVTMDQAVR